VTRQRRQEALERTFFFDLNNQLHGVLGAQDLLEMRAPACNGSQLAGLRRQGVRLAQEITFQRVLVQGLAEAARAGRTLTIAASVLADIRDSGPDQVTR
jgi:hypothetical protein